MVNVRPKQDRISVWTKTAANEALQVRSCCGGVTGGRKAGGYCRQQRSTNSAGSALPSRRWAATEGDAAVPGLALRISPTTPYQPNRNLT